MQTSKEILEKAGIKPKLHLGLKGEHGVTPTGPHTVKLVKDKEIPGTDDKGRPIQMVRFLLEENGELKTYDVPKFKKDSEDIHYLVQRLAEYKEGTVLILEMKKKGIKNYVEVRLVSDADEAEVDDDEVDMSGDVEEK